MKCKQPNHHLRKPYFITSTSNPFQDCAAVLKFPPFRKSKRIPNPQTTTTTFNLSFFVCLTICFSTHSILIVVAVAVAVVVLWILVDFCRKKNWILLLIKMCLFVELQIFFMSVSNGIVLFHEIYHILCCRRQ